MKGSLSRLGRPARRVRNSATKPVSLILRLSSTARRKTGTRRLPISSCIRVRAVCVRKEVNQASRPIMWPNYN